MNITKDNQTFKERMQHKTGAPQLTTPKNETIQRTKANKHPCPTTKYPNEICGIIASMILVFFLISSTQINTADGYDNM